MQAFVHAIVLARILPFTPASVMHRDSLASLATYQYIMLQTQSFCDFLAPELVVG
jgi:hypothetical protein